VKCRAFRDEELVKCRRAAHHIGWDGRGVDLRAQDRERWESSVECRHDYAAFSAEMNDTDGDDEG